MNVSTSAAAFLIVAAFVFCGCVRLAESERASRHLAGLFHKWMRRHFFEKLVIVLGIAMFTVWGGGKTNQEDVVLLPPGEEMYMDGGGTLIEGGSQSMSGEGLPRLSTNQYKAGFALLTNAVIRTSPWLAVPPNAVTHAPWTRYGLAEDTFWLPATNWSFVLGTNAVEGAHVSSSGTLSFRRRQPKGSPRAAEMPDVTGIDFLAPLQGSLGTVPPEGRFWHAVTDSNSVLMTWQDLCAGRFTNSPVTFQAELFRNGDFVYRYAFTNALSLTNFVVGAQHGGGGETFALNDTNKLVNGLELRWRAFGMLDPGIDDHDGDGLSTYDEVMVYGTSPSMPDTDLDGLSDFEEVTLSWTNPLLRDTDGDGIPDGGDPDPLSADAADLDGDGLPDAWETRWFGSTNATDSADADSNADGLSDRVNLLTGTGPAFAACAVTASHGGHTFTWTALPGATNFAASVIRDGAAVWSCVTGACVVSVTGDFSSAVHTLAVTSYGGATSHTASVTFRQPSQPNLTVWKIADPFGLALPQGCTNVLGRSFQISRTGAWQQYFISSGRDSAGGWALEGLRLDWSDSGGGSGSAAASPAGDSLRLAVSTNSPQTLTVRIVPDGTGAPARSPRPLYLIGWSPAVAFSSSGTVTAVTEDGAVLAAVSDRSGGGTAAAFTVGLDGRPCFAAPGADEIAQQSDPFVAGSGVSFEGSYGPGGRLSGGTVRAGGPGLFGLSCGFYGGGGGGGGFSGGGGSVQPPPPAPPSGGPVPPASILLFSPSVAVDADEGFCSCSGSEERGVEEWPFGSGCLRSWWRNGGGCGDYLSEPGGVTVTAGSEELDALVAFYINGVETPSRSRAWVGDERSATGAIVFEDVTLWSASAEREPAVSGGCGGSGREDEGECGCGGCESGDCGSIEGDVTGSVRFRIPLGMTGYRQLAGFVWFDMETPQNVTPALFTVTGNASVACVSNNPGGALSDIVCWPDGGRTVTLGVLSSPPGVALTVYEHGETVPSHTWEITNPDGSNTVRAVRKDGTGTIVRDALYTCSNGTWTREDRLAGSSESVFHGPPLVTGGSEFEYRAIADSGGTRTLSQTETYRASVGSGAAAVTRDTSVWEWDGAGSSWRETAMTWWADSLNPLVNGLPKFRRRDDGSWEYRAFDARGRETLRAEPLGGSGHPPFAADPVPFAVASCAAYAPFDALVTETSYAPLTGDGDALGDSRKAREVSVYAVTGGVPARVSREWRVLTRCETNGFPALAVRAVRAASPSSAFADAANAVSLSVSVAEDDGDVPVLLRGRPLREERPGGAVLTWTYEYGTYDPETPSFTPDPAGAALRVTARSGTSALPDGVEGASVYTVEILDAVFGRTLRRETRLHDGGAPGALLSWETREYDARGRRVSSAFSDGTAETDGWGCCQKDYAVSREGTRRDFLAVPGLPLWSAEAETSSGGLPGADGHYPVTETAVDAVERVTNSVRCVWSGGSPDSAYAPLETRTEYPYGTEHYRVTTDPLDVATISRTYYGNNCEIGETVSAGVTNRVTRYWGGATVEEEFKTDPVSGEPLSRATRTETSWDANGCEVVTVSVSRNGGAWATESVTRKDFLGRVITSDRAGYGGAMLVTSNAYDTAGRLVYTLNPDGSAVANAYDELGNGAGTVRIGAGQTLDFDPQDFTLVGVAALDKYVIGETPSWKEESDLGLSAYGVPTAYWDCSAVVSHLPGQGAVTTSVTRVQLTGLSPACVARAVMTDADGENTITAESLDADNAGKTVTRLNVATAESETSVTVAGRATGGTNALGAAFAYTYDGFARQTSAEETAGSRTLRTLTGYHADGTAAFTSQADGASTNVTSYSVRQSLESPGGAYLVIVTDPLGNATTTFFSADGSPYRSEGATYPTATALDADGRQAELRTWRDETGQPDITRWFRDQDSGLVTNKVYADGRGPAYTHTADGRLASRTWARGVTTAYSYADTADGLVQTATYSDATPDITNRYDLAGRLVAVADGAGTRTLSYNAQGRLSSETNSLAALARVYDSLGRDTGYDLSVPGFSTGVFSVRYGYDGAGRLNRVTSVLNGISNTFTYTFVEGTALAAGMTGSSGIGWTRSYEPQRNLIAAVSNYWNSSSVSSFAYENDALGRRTRRLDTAPALSATNVFAYNRRSEVTNAAMIAATYSYVYDDIGNRLQATADAATSLYVANTLNQYVTVTNSGVNVPMTYDFDGNMTRNEAWYHYWDGENNMKVAAPVDATNGSLRVENGYDYMKRRVIKTVTMLTGYEPPSGTPPMPGNPGEWVPLRTTQYVWDGWNIAAEIVVEEAVGSTNIIYYTWGLDLSGTLQGAGGVGGLLAVTKASSSATNAYFAGADANGNVTEYVDDSGTSVAHYEYSAFGETTAKSGSMADDFTHRYSTKPFEVETGYSKYQQRDYIPPLARWASRDPIEERGGLNLHVMVMNNTVNFRDSLGLQKEECPCKIEDVDAEGRKRSAESVKLTINTKITKDGMDFNPEFAGRICCKKGKVYSKPPHEGPISWVIDRYGKGGWQAGSGLYDAPKCDQGDKEVGIYHSHPTGSGFSLADKGNACIYLRNTGTYFCYRYYNGKTCYWDPPKGQWVCMPE